MSLVMGHVVCTALLFKFSFQSHLKFVKQKFNITAMDLGFFLFLWVEERSIFPGISLVTNFQLFFCQIPIMKIVVFPGIVNRSIYDLEDQQTSKGLTIKLLFMLRGDLKVHKFFVLGLLIFKQH